MVNHTYEMERRFRSFRGGEEGGMAIHSTDVAQVIADALQAALYQHIRPSAVAHPPDRIYHDNESFWRDAILHEHFPGRCFVLDGFYLTEWLPFSPGRYYTSGAESLREDANRSMSNYRDEYLPDGKRSMVRGGIGAIRLAEKMIDARLLYFLGASSTGIAHQGIPVAVSSDVYREAMPLIRSNGGCRVKLTGTVQSLREGFPSLDYSAEVPRYLLIAEEVSVYGAAKSEDLLVTAAIMFSANDASSIWDPTGEPRFDNKSWTFCSFHPGDRDGDVKQAAAWLLDYARRYSQGNPSILTDFDEHHHLFPCPVEFPLSDIVRGSVDWESLRVYKARHLGTIIERYTKIMGDNFNVSGNNINVTNRSIVMKAFNAVDEDTAKALQQIDEAINRSGSKEAVENFDSFSEELAKPQAKKFILKSLWQGTMAALPTLMELPDAIEKVAKLFT